MPSGHLRRRILVTLAAILVSLPLPALAGPDLAARIAEAFGQAIVGVVGTEAQGTYEFDYLGTHVRIDILGLAFCSPADPWIEPDPAAVPPASGYGCLNSYLVAATVPPSEDAATVTLTLDDIFVDLSTTRSRSILCGESAGDPLTRDGYLLSGAVVTAGLALSGIGGCVQAELVPGSVRLVMGEATLELLDSCLADFWGSLGDGLLADLEAALQEAMADLIAGQMAEFNGALCLLTDVRPTTWGGFKAIYGEMGATGTDR